MNSKDIIIMAENKNKGAEIAPLKAFNQFITNPRTQDYLQSILADKKGSFVNNITALVANNDMLQPCKPETLMFACLKATSLGLPLDQSLGFAYVLPYKDNKKGITVAQFQMGYKGFIQLAFRSGQFKNLNVTDIRKGEILERNFITGEIKFAPIINREELPVIGYCAYMKLINGFEKYFYMTVDEIKAHAHRYSQTYRKGYGLWTDEEMFGKMAEKTAMKLMLSKYAPLSVEMQEALAADQAILLGKDEYEYIDNVPEEELVLEAVNKKKAGMRESAQGEGESEVNDMP